LRPALPRLGLGLFLGSIGVDEDRLEGDQVGLIGRLRLDDEDRFEIEAEISATEFEGAGRRDHQLGGALIWNLNPHRRWVLYLLAGGGGARIQASGGSYETSQSYAELGIGLQWRLTHHLHLQFDLRGGGRAVLDERRDERLPATLPAVADEESFARSRLSGLFYF
jgi:hypothetical protein